MGLPKQPTKDIKLAESLDEVRNLKQVVDVKQQEIASLQAALDQFGAQYHIYARTLQHRRQDLERNIQVVRFQIENAKRHNLPTPDLPEAGDDEESAPQYNETSTGQQEVGPLRIAEDPAQRAKVTARNFFARFWHPDTGNVAYLESMHKLNTAFKGSKDLADMLIVLPWSEDWLKPGENETMGDQLVRLYDWCDALKQASERLDENRLALQRHEFYQSLQEKQAAEEHGDDYFAQVAVRERDEILRLEQSLATLQSQLEIVRQA